MMTYFGVNFYLSGLHSYASGDVPVTPSFVWYFTAFVFLELYLGLSTKNITRSNSLNF